MEYKVCPGCNQTLETTQFSKDKYRKDGLRRKCKICSSKEFSAFKNSPGYAERIVRAKKTKQETKQKTPKVVWAHTAYHNSKARAKLLGVEHTITKAWLIDNAVDCCPLLGVVLVYNSTVCEANSASIDRKDSSKGYTPENCKVVSFKANRIKNNASIDELKLLVQNIDSY